MLPMRLLRALRESAGSRAEVRRKSGGGPGPVSVPHRIALCGDAPSGARGRPGRFRGFGRASAAACAFLRVSLRLRHPHPVLRASLRLRVLFCGLLCGSGIRTLSCERLCGGVCFAAALSAVRAAGLRPLLCLLFCGPFVQRGADAAFFAPCGPRLRRVSRIGGPPSRLALTARLPASLRRPGVFAAPVGGRGRPVRFRPSPGPDPPAARAAPHSGRRRGIAALPGLFRFGGRCESSVIIRKCAGDGIVE